MPPYFPHPADPVLQLSIFSTHPSEHPLRPLLESFTLSSTRHFAPLCATLQRCDATLRAISQGRNLFHLPRADLPSHRAVVVGLIALKNWLSGQNWRFSFHCPFFVFIAIFIKRSWIAHKGVYCIFTNIQSSSFIRKKMASLSLSLCCGSKEMNA